MLYKLNNNEFESAAKNTDTAEQVFIFNYSLIGQRYILGTFPCMWLSVLSMRKIRTANLTLKLNDYQ